ncbi:MAG TPA: hypothetical protein VJB90_03745 [Candidatus Nanoarchaeia archaeon]|nr:hypothetical protein [Candidatus Nanoarchaeia archaeon]
MRQLLVIFLILTIFIAGCPSDDSSSTGDKFRTGTQALAISFIQNQPPSRIVLQNDQDYPADVAIELRNLGAEDIVEGTGVLIFSGYDGNLVTWGLPSKSKPIPKLDGKSFSNPQGGKDIVQVDGNIITTAIGEVYRPVFQVTACYDYKTQAQISMCIDPDPTGKSTKPCSAADISASSGQGGPIVVTAIDQEASPGETLFKITVKNAGGGDVFIGGFGKCLGTSNEGELNYRDLDRVNIESVSVGNTQITISCKGLENGVLALTNGQGVFYCNAKFPKGSSFQTTFNVVISYQYRTSASKTIEIVKLS